MSHCGKCLPCRLLFNLRWWRWYLLGPTPADAIDARGDYNSDNRRLQMERWKAREPKP
jgi:hypothetical protein